MCHKLPKKWLQGRYASHQLLALLSLVLQTHTVSHWTNRLMCKIDRYILSQWEAEWFWSYQWNWALCSFFPDLVTYLSSKRNSTYLVIRCSYDKLMAPLHAKLISLAMYMQKCNLFLVYHAGKLKNKTTDRKICQKISRQPNSEGTKCKENVVWDHLHLVRVFRSCFYCRFFARVPPPGRVTMCASVGGILNLDYPTNRSSTISSGHHLGSPLEIVFERWSYPD